MDDKENFVEDLFSETVESPSNPNDFSSLQPLSTSSEAPELEIGTFNLRLHLPGLFDIQIPIPAPKPPKKYAYLKELYNSLKGKYWSLIKRGEKRICKCLICGMTYRSTTSIRGHLNRHLGFYIARCQKCNKSFYDKDLARSHYKKCIVKP